MTSDSRGKRLVLVDGMAVMYRSFFAIRSLSTEDGRPTNAVFGFIRKLNELQKTWDPTHLAVVFDGGVPEARLELLEAYKANRPPVPDGLREQVGVVEEYLDRAGIAWAREEGQEADDVLASIVTWASAQAGQVLITTSDKDMYQLVSDKVNVVPPAGKGKCMGPREILGKTGVQPSKIVEWLALVGDTADNIPGVPGVGPKTAAGLLRQFDSLEGMWTHLHDIKSERVRKALAEHRADVERNVQMVRLNRSVPCPFTWDDMARHVPDAGRLIPFLESLEFFSMVAELREQSLFPDQDRDEEA